jgi:hypothetical protein
MFMEVNVDPEKGGLADQPFLANFVYGDDVEKYLNVERLELTHVYGGLVKDLSFRGIGDFRLSGTLVGDDGERRRISNVRVVRCGVDFNKDAKLCPYYLVDRKNKMTYRIYSAAASQSKAFNKIQSKIKVLVEMVAVLEASGSTSLLCWEGAEKFNSFLKKDTEFVFDHLFWTLDPDARKKVQGIINKKTARKTAKMMIGDY